MNARLYISDLDGTLLRSDATLSSTARDGLNQLLDAGLAFTIATSRASLIAVTNSLWEFAYVSGHRAQRLHLRPELRNTQPAASAGDVADTAVRAMLDGSLKPILTSWDGVDDHVYYDSGAQHNPGTAWYIAEKDAYCDPRLRCCDDIADVVGIERIATVTTFLPHSLADALADQFVSSSEISAW